MQPETFPPLKRALFEAKRAAYAAATEEERAQHVESRRRAQENAVAARNAKRELNRTIAALGLAGYEIDEISKMTGVPVQGIWKRRLTWALPISSRKGFRRLLTWVPDLGVDALDALAEDVGVDRQRALDAIVKNALADGAFIARRSLGVRRKAVAA